MDRLLDVLGDSVRREVIQYFEAQQDAPVATLDELIAHLDRTLPLDSRQLRLALRHVHLPKLGGNGWLDFDARSEQIRYHGNQNAHDLLEELIDVFEG